MKLTKKSPAKRNQRFIKCRAAMYRTRRPCVLKDWGAILSSSGLQFKLSLICAGVDFFSSSATCILPLSISDKVPEVGSCTFYSVVATAKRGVKAREDKAHQNVWPKIS